MKYLFLKYSVFALFGLTFFACQPAQKGDRKAMIREVIEKRLADFKKNKMKSCEEELIKTATAKVDSLLIERARRNKNSLDKPVIPDKPEVPEIISPIDSSPIEPILPGDSLN